ncbi:MAG: PAS domain-containing protein [Candidatus Omnitrophica bacterium]|nr:PAS domain-containing protein [Candidatus Omnitrophota bacterium]MCF7878667.1 PAS domain-containing protein [Candidatus Omnitrophota bacterium]MCF7893369.1 PAS domain-containing protein [Candidatus Omnitrophota bacterium]
MAKNEYKKQRKKLVKGAKTEDLVRLFTELMDNIPDVIYFKDKKGKIVLVNRAYAKGLGTTPDKVVGKTDFDIFPKSRAKLMQKDDLWVIKNKKPIIDKVERATRPDGQDNYSSTTKIPRFDEKGSVIGLIGITRDITRRRRLEQLEEDKHQMQRKIRSLKEINQLKSEFISIVSHELRTPLAIINQVVMVLLDELTGPLNEKQKDVIAKAKNNVNRLSNMVNKLLDVSRMQRGVLELHYGLINLKSLLKDFGDSFQEFAKKKGITIKYDFCSDDINLFCDPERLSQIVSNLIDNAVKFTEEKSTITIELRKMAAKVRIGVIDQGIGIAKNKINKIFDKFSQVSGLTRSNKEGVGLGLSLVKDLVKKHNGKIWVESKLGVGSKFYFTLPLLYKFQLTNSEMIGIINNALAKGLFVYLIEVIIIKSKKGISGRYIVKKDFFDKIKKIVNETVREYKKTNKINIKVVGDDYKKRTISIASIEKNSKESTMFSNLLKEKIKKVLSENATKDIFINLGTLHYPDKSKQIIPKQLASSFNIQKIFTGKEVRRFRRFCYHATLKFNLSIKGGGTGDTIDISRGGLCFKSNQKLQKGDKLEVELMVPNRKKELKLVGKVAWVVQAEENNKGFVRNYKIGIEFFKLSQSQRKVIIKAIKDIAK